MRVPQADISPMLGATVVVMLAACGGSNVGGSGGIIQAPFNLPSSSSSSSSSGQSGSGELPAIRLL